jgi:hypothetical protein
LREPEDRLAFRGTPRNAFPTRLRRQLLPALHLLYGCNPNIVGIADLDTPTLQKDERAGEFPEPFIDRGRLW